MSEPIADPVAAGWLDWLDAIGPAVREKFKEILEEESLIVVHTIDYDGSATIQGPIKEREIPLKFHMVGKHRIAFTTEKNL